MKRYDVAAIRRALAELDDKLERATELTLIGGAAVALLLDDRDLVTKDIDGFAMSRALLRLARDLSIAIDPASIADLPWNFEDRRVGVLRLTFLDVRVPEPHDLLLSKIMRWSPGDEDHVRRLHARRPLDLDLLIDRYRTEMTHVVGDPRRIRSHFLDCIDTLFGEVASRRAAGTLPAP